MLLLWMSMICMIPFDMSRLDSGVAGAGDQQTKSLPTMDRILNVAKVSFHTLTLPVLKAYNLAQCPWKLIFSSGVYEFQLYFKPA